MKPILDIPKIILNNNCQIPVIGLGTWKCKSEALYEVVKNAIHLGYRHIDCAAIYENENKVGEAIAYEMKQNTVCREDLFITSKLWNTLHRPNVVEVGIQQSLNDLQLDYLDLYLMHWPMAYQEGDNFVPLNSKGQVIHSNVSIVETWKAMEDLIKKNLVKSIGVCNFNKRQIETLIKSSSTVPVVNQVECHPLLNQTKLKEYCNANKICITCYSPLGSPDRPWAKPNEPVVLETPLLFKLSRKYKKTPAQITLKYQIQRQNIVIPKSVNKHRLHENLSLFDFNIDEDDMNSLNGLDKGIRYISLRRDSKHPEYPFIDPF